MSADLIYHNTVVTPSPALIAAEPHNRWTATSYLGCLPHVTADGRLVIIDTDPEVRGSAVEDVFEAGMWASFTCHAPSTEATS